MVFYFFNNMCFVWRVERRGVVRGFRAGEEGRGGG